MGGGAARELKKFQVVDGGLVAGAAAQTFGGREHVAEQRGGFAHTGQLRQPTGDGGLVVLQVGKAQQAVTVGQRRGGFHRVRAQGESRQHGEVFADDGLDARHREGGLRALPHRVAVFV